MDIKEFEIRKKYSESSGVMTIVDSNIEIFLNEYGLYEEMIRDKNQEISPLIELVSPNLNKNSDEYVIAKELFSENKSISYDKRIGYYESLYVGHVLEDNYRENASSGGMGTWIFKELMENNMIDYVIHVKKNKDGESNLFQYGISSTIEEIKEGAKTRYYPVEFSEVIKILKENSGRYAIIGIPSFIYSIRLLSKVDKTVADRIVYTIGLICGHQKSSKFAESLAWQVGVTPGNLVDIDFRHKIVGKPANHYGVKITGFIDGKLETIIKPAKDFYGQNWGWGLFKPQASDFTDDVFNETADIVLGDAWLPEFVSDYKGNNIIIVRNEEINTLIKKSINSKKIKMISVDKETIFKSQASHYKHTHDELGYRLKSSSNEWLPKKRVAIHNKTSKTRQKIQDLRKDISENSHIYYKEAVKRKDLNYFIQNMNLYTSKYSKLYRKVNRLSSFKRLLKLTPAKVVRKLQKKFT